MTPRWARPLAALLVILCGLALQAGPYRVWGSRLWLGGLVLLGLPVVWQTLRGVFAGRFAADLVASLAIATAVGLDQPLAGMVVVLMQTGGEALEQYAAGRASRAVQALEAAAPRQANRLRDSGVETVSAELVQIGDQLLIRPGEMVPCDCLVRHGHSHVDASRLTGEPIPLTAGPKSRLMSGSLNLEGPLTVEATAPARESQYARIVQLVRHAQESKSPLQRMADRYAVVFTPITLAVCLISWFGSRDPLRILAVLVVATPCPLILAAPVAMIGGLNRAARGNIIIRHGEALERLGEVTAALLDKTGTLTVGHPEVGAIRAVPPYDADAVLAATAAVEAGSGHLLAASIVTRAAERGLTVPKASGVLESAGQGVSGQVEGHEVAVGAQAWIHRRYPAIARGWPDGDAPGLRAWIAIDGHPAGVVEFADQVRPEATRLIAGLERLGFRRIIMVTGDHAGHAEAVARAVGLTEFRANLLPADKVAAVEELESAGERVLMVGDGTNDAPALTRATVGVALAAHGGGITAEAADAVVLADDPALVVDAVAISRRTMRIARQSIWAGLGLSAAAMVAAALGHIPPTVGAVLQEVIDVAVILNALRASAEPAGT